MLRQSDFGIASFSVLGGLLTIQDEVVIEFVLKGHKHAANNPVLVPKFRHFRIDGTIAT